MDNKKLLDSLAEFYESRAATPDPFVEQDLSYIRQDIESDFLFNIGNISDSLYRLAVHNAVIGVAALLKNDGGGWAPINVSMLYSFWSIRLAERALQRDLSMNPDRSLPGLRTMFSEAAGLLLYCIGQEQREMAEATADILQKIFTRPRYLDSYILEESVYERFALNLYHARYSGDNPAHLKSARPSVYDGLEKRLLAEFNESDVSALCDFHCANIEDRGDRRPPFSTPPFDIIPIEILAIYKLRSGAGLRNPRADHPLLNPVFMDMPASRFENDSIIDAVEAGYIETFGF